MPRREVEGVAHVRFGIEIGESRLGRGRRRGHGEVDAAGIDHREIEQAAFGQRLDMGEALGRCHAGCGNGGIGRIDRHIDLGADAFDDAGIDLPVEGVRAVLEGMRVDDRRAGAGAGDALGDDRLDRIRKERLQLAIPRAVQRDFDPDLVHGGSFAGLTADNRITAWKPSTISSSSAAARPAPCLQPD